MKRRWGWMLTILKGKHFKVKLLYFKEGGEISRQKHNHRSELWLFLMGWGHWHDYIVPNPWKRLRVGKGEYRHVSVNQWHKFRAFAPTLVIECQYGTKCSERDIERSK